MKNKKTYIITIAIILVLILAITIVLIDYKKTHSETAKLELNNVEVVGIDIQNNSGELQVTTTLQNNSREDINGYFIELNLLDKDGNTITTIATNSEETIPAKGQTTITNYTTPLENNVKVANVEIVTMEKGTSEEAVENAFDELQ